MAAPPPTLELAPNTTLYPPKATELAHCPAEPPREPVYKELSAGAVRRTLKLSVLEGGLIQIFLNWTTGSVIVGYMLHLGASRTDIGLIMSVPMLAQLASPFAAYLGGVAGRLKGITALCAFLGRALWLLAAFLPLLGVPTEWQPAFVVGLVLVSSLFQASTATLWTSWLGSVVPEARRGRYFGFRAGVVGIVGMVANLGAGWFLDRVSAPLNFQVVLGVGVVSALLGVFVLLLHSEPPVTQKRPHFREVFKTPWQDLNFRKFLLFGVYWHASVFIAAPFVFTYFLDRLKMSFTEVAVWSIVAAVSAFFTTNWWGHVADRYGNKVVLAVGTTVAGSAMPLSWMLASEGHLWPVWFSAVFDAVAWGAVGPAIFNLALASAPKEDRTAFVAMHRFATGAAGFVGGLLSGPLLVLFSRLELTSWGVTWTGFHSLCSQEFYACRRGVFYAPFRRRGRGARATCCGRCAPVGAAADFSGPRAYLNINLVLGTGAADYTHAWGRYSRNFMGSLTGRYRRSGCTCLGTAFLDWFIGGSMSNPEQLKDEPLTRPGVEDNIPVQNGSDEVYDRPTPKGKNTILLVSLVLVVVAVIAVVWYLF